MHAAFRVEQPRTFLIAPDEDDSEIENRTYEQREEGEGGAITGFRGIWCSLFLLLSASYLLTTLTRNIFRSMFQTWLCVIVLLYNKLSFAP